MSKNNILVWIFSKLLLPLCQSLEKIADDGDDNNTTLFEAIISCVVPIVSLATLLITKRFANVDNK